MSPINNTHTIKVIQEYINFFQHESLCKLRNFITGTFPELQREKKGAGRDRKTERENETEIDRKRKEIELGERRGWKGGGKERAPNVFTHKEVFFELEVVQLSMTCV